jgi:hypothetical protein
VVVLGIYGNTPEAASRGGSFFCFSAGFYCFFSKMGYIIRNGGGGFKGSKFETGSIFL